MVDHALSQNRREVLSTLHRGRVNVLVVTFCSYAALHAARKAFSNSKAVQSLCWPACVKLVGNWLTPVHHLIDDDDDVSTTSEDSDPISIADGQIGIVTTMPVTGVSLPTLEALLRGLGKIWHAFWLPFVARYSLVYACDYLISSSGGDTNSSAELKAQLNRIRYCYYLHSGVA
ncbi:hypothetical protein Pmar_PMAR025643, partial [Perkinsus marinus ATCC 50983]